MKYLLLIVLSALLIWSEMSCKKSAEKSEIPAESKPLIFLQVSFDLIDFIGWNDEEGPDKIKLKEMREKDFFISEDVSVLTDKVFNQDPFCFWCFAQTLFLIDKKTPTQCVQLGGLDCMFTSSVHVERLNGKFVRIFVESGGNGRFGSLPRTAVWDYDNINKYLTRYIVNEYACARDIENKGARDLILYQIDDQVEYATPAQIMSWSGKHWEDVTEIKKGLLKGFDCNVWDNNKNSPKLPEI